MDFGRIPSKSLVKSASTPDRFLRRPVQDNPAPHCSLRALRILFRLPGLLAPGTRTPLPWREVLMATNRIDQQGPP